MIRVTTERPGAALAAHWETLPSEARNVFMHPAALSAATKTQSAEITVLLAWDTAVEPNKLVGWWALEAKRLQLWPYLATLPYNYAFLSTPVIDAGNADAVMPAFMAAITADRRLPNTLMVRDFDAAGPAHDALMTAEAPTAALKTDQRPYATRDAGLKRSGSTRKKLRQDWNRLAATGELDVVDVREPGPLAEAIEAFLEMEAAGWKGSGGTALLSDPRDAAFARRFVTDMAAQGAASVALLRLDNKPIAAQVLLYSGRTAYTWKTSYDPDLGKHSPGTLLVDRVSTDLLDGNTVDMIDSCSIGDGFMASLWSARRPMTDLVVSASPRPSLSYYVLIAYFRAREAAKALRNRMLKRRHNGPRVVPTVAAKPVAAPQAGPFAESATGPSASERATRADRPA